jgi:hypothetical protein
MPDPGGEARGVWGVVPPGGDTVGWLLRSDEPAVRALARRDLLGEPGGSDDITRGPWVSALLAGPVDDNPYRKWTGAHWRLVALAELGVTDPRAADRLLDWIVGAERYRTGPQVVDGLARVHASIDGNVLAVVSRSGLAGDARAGRIAAGLIAWQWPDGGWNCDQSASGRRSSFHESLAAAWGLHEYAEATGSASARTAARRTAELFLDHRLFRSLRTGRVINPRWLRPPYPPYWHYDILQALTVLGRMGLGADPRAADALDELERRRRADGRWNAGAQWWKPPGSGTVTPEAVDWGRAGQPNEMVTLNALRALTAAGRR